MFWIRFFLFIYSLFFSGLNMPLTVITKTMWRIHQETHRVLENSFRPAVVWPCVHSDCCFWGGVFGMGKASDYDQDHAKESTLCICNNWRNVHKAQRGTGKKDFISTAVPVLNMFCCRLPCFHKARRLLVFHGVAVLKTERQQSSILKTQIKHKSFFYK